MKEAATTYWQAFYRFQAGVLSETEQYKFFLVGIVREAQARHRGESYIPYVWQNPDATDRPSQRELMIGLGITLLALEGADKC